jgi:hypothetical protein
MTASILVKGKQTKQGSGSLYIILVQFCTDLNVVLCDTIFHLWGKKFGPLIWLPMQFMLHHKHYAFLHEGNINHDHRQ